LNDSPCEKCVLRKKQCERRKDGAIGCERCKNQKQGCSIIDRRGKKQATEHGSKSAEPEEGPVPTMVPHMVLTLSDKSMVPFALMLEAARSTATEVAAMRADMWRTANTLEELVGLLRERRASEPVGVSGETGGVEETADRMAVDGTSAKLAEKADLPTDSDSSDDGEQEAKEDEDEDDEESDDDEGDGKGDEDVEMGEGSSKLVGCGGPIGTIGGPLRGPASSSS
jgi:hypothetical protein